MRQQRGKRQKYDEENRHFIDFKRYLQRIPVGVEVFYDIACAQEKYRQF
jgi:hypothetical protein